MSYTEGNKENENIDVEKTTLIEEEQAKNLTSEKQEDKKQGEEKKQKKEIDFKINSGNIAVISSSLALLLSTVNKLLRMLVLVSAGLVIFLYIVSALLSFFALFSCIKNSFKNKQITIDAYLCGISLLVLILI